MIIHVSSPSPFEGITAAPFVPYILTEDRTSLELSDHLTLISIQHRHLARQVKVARSPIPYLLPVRAMKREHP